MFFFFQAEDGIRDVERSRGLGDVYKRQGINAEYMGPGSSRTLPIWFQLFAIRFQVNISKRMFGMPMLIMLYICLLYTSDAADDTPCVDLGGRRIIKKKKKNNKNTD
eukprot:TRINITY_DN10892_c0_g1_i5.p1 TRINITY_DN10892_c0_g1~~TRINITY_DN10892_c0_g1_i5.p1  ORF type:complete len:107 (-),score=38.81 TRINITY_DN10892_c0_g1_i5:93-413(-)